jgi:DNA polymerase III delta prime subunit
LTGSFRAVLISGPPGIGKTTAAHLIAKLAGYSILELNASDTRSKKLLEVNHFLLSRFPVPSLIQLIYLSRLSVIPSITPHWTVSLKEILV